MTDIVDRLRDRDAIVIGGMFHAVPALREAADEIERLRTENLAKQEMLKALEWSGGYDAYDRPLCPWCQSRKTNGHHEACDLAQRIKE